MFQSMCINIFPGCVLPSFHSNSQQHIHGLFWQLAHQSFCKEVKGHIHFFCHLINYYICYKLRKQITYLYHVCLGFYMHFYRFRSTLSSNSIISCILDKGYQVCPCFSIKCSIIGLLLIICLTLNLSLKGIITELH